MSKSCCNHSHAAPIKAIGKATPHQHRHDSHCCDKVASASGCANPAPQDHQAHGVDEGPGDEDPSRGRDAEGTPSHPHDHDHRAHGAAAEGPLPAPTRDSRRHSWQVLGMDCPSCARKIETAVNRVEGVTQARVLFATEKLVVDLAPGLSPDPVTAAVLAAGFRLKGNSQATEGDDKRLSPLMTLLGKYWQPLSLAALMGVAALLPAQLGQPLFTLATLWGLWPVARKA